jgi:hypothetical protein
MLLTLAILVATLAGYALGFVGSRKYHRRAYAQAEAELIAQTRDAICSEIFEIAKKVQAERESA